MKSIAKALVDAAAFLELSGDDVVDPDSAVGAMEMIISDLAGCTQEEKSAIAEAAATAASESKNSGSSAEMIQFYENFINNCGLGEE